MQLFKKNSFSQQPKPTDTHFSSPSQDQSIANSPPISAEATDVEKQKIEDAIVPDKVSAFKGLGWLDRFLALWILLAMAIGIIFGNFVPNTGPALQKGKFVGVSVPIGELLIPQQPLCVSNSKTVVLMPLRRKPSGCWL